MKTNSSPRTTARAVLVISILMATAGGGLPAQVSMREESWVLPTYPVAPADKNPIFFKGEAYQGASRHVYPLGLNDVISHERTDHAWKALLLENEYIKLCVTPEIGGKLYYATDKTNGYNFIYKNNVVKPANIGMTGAWVSGGIEWCVLHHHRASTFLPVDHALVENADGSKTIWIGETEPRHRMRWSIALTLTPDKSYFEAAVTIHNPTPFTHSFLYWANVATHTNEHYQAIFPPSTEFVAHHAKVSFARWPFATQVYRGTDFTRGVDISWWKNVTTSASFFVHDLQEDFMGGYDHGRQTGTVHVGDHHIIKGAKLWEWGSGPRGQATEGRLTEQDGPYVELMVGAFSDNQPDYSWIRPYETKTFKQYWYPVRDIQGFKYANLNGAVNLEPRDGNKVFLGYYSTQPVPRARIRLTHLDRVVHEGEVRISPAESFTATIDIGGAYKLTNLATELTDIATGETLVAYRPVAPPKSGHLPEEVKSPAPPEEIGTVEQLFLTGSRIEQFHNPGFQPMDYFAEALRRDPGDIRTNVAVGSRLLRNGDYSSARDHFSKAIARQTKDYTKPASGEALYLLGLALVGLESSVEAYDAFYRATWDHAQHSAAYVELARISSQQGNFAKALEQIDESLSTNTRNSRAIALKASILRRLGNYKDAAATLANAPRLDPLDFRMGNEKYLIALESGRAAEAAQALAGLETSMRSFEQNYLELAVGYLNDGLVRESGEVLRRFKGKNPLVEYYLGHILAQTGNKAEAARRFKAGAGMPVDSIFPHRLETLKILETALHYNPDDGNAHYYIGNILYEKQPGRAIQSWEQAVKCRPALAVAHRNLGWGYYRHLGDSARAVAAYERAVALDRNEAIYYAELDSLYEISNTPVARRVKLFAGSDDVVRKRDDSSVRQIMVLTLAGQPEQAVAHLTGRKFSYREGNSRVREVIIDAQLMLGRKHLAARNYRKALASFLEARIPDEEAGSARAGDRSVQVNYHIGLAHEALGERGQAEAAYKAAAGQTTSAAGFMRYYQGLSYAKLGERAKADEIFAAMVAEADSQLAGSGSQGDFFAIFGERETEKSRKSLAHTSRGLGYKGLGQSARAEADLRMAVELAYSNLWANAESENSGK